LLLSIQATLFGTLVLNVRINSRLKTPIKNKSMDSKGSSSSRSGENTIEFYGITSL